MELLPRTMGTRPRVAIEVRPEGLVAARAEDAAGLLGVVTRTDLREGALRPGLKSGNVAERAAVAGAVRRTLDGVSPKGGERSKYVTLVVPDAAVRVLLLDFDALPNKAAEALAVVRFRLKKLLPFDAEHAVVTYQVMSSGRDGIRVLAVAMPCDVLAEYEGLVTDAGYLPGAVLPSTLAALAGLDSGEGVPSTALIVNAGPGAVTTAIVQGGVLLLHRTVDMGTEMGGSEAGGSEPGSVTPTDGLLPGELAPGERLPLVGREGSTTGGWRQDAQDVRGQRDERDLRDLKDPRDLRGERDLADPRDYDRMDAETVMQSQVLRRETRPSQPTEIDEAVQVLRDATPVSSGREITQAVSVAAAYFEDTLGGAPSVVLAAGTMGAERLGAVLDMYGMDGMRVREMVDVAAIGLGASTSTVPRGWLAGVRGALRS